MMTKWYAIHGYSIADPCYQHADFVGIGEEETAKALTLPWDWSYDAWVADVQEVENN